LKKFIRNGLSILMPMIVYIFITMLVTMYVFIGIIITCTLLAKGNISVGLTASQEVLAQFMNLLDIEIQLINILIFSLWYKMLCDKKPSYKNIKGFALKVKDIGIIVVMSININIIINPIMYFYYYFLPDSIVDYSNLMNRMTEGNTITTYVLILILGPIAEELLFRGVILNKLNRLLPFYLANIIQAILFGLFHMNLVQSSYTIFIGLVFGYVAYRYHTICASILCHMFFNLLGGVVIGAINIDASLPIYGMASVINAIILLFIIRRLNKRFSCD